MHRSILIVLIILITITGCQNTTPTEVTQTNQPPTPTELIVSPTMTRETSQPATATSPLTPEPQPESTPTMELTGQVHPEGSPIPTLASREEFNISMVEMVNPDAGWAIGSREGGPDHIFFTRDGGVTWLDRSPPAVKPDDANTYKAWGFFLDTSTAWVLYAGDGPPPVGPQRVWRTTDSGQTWEASQTLPLTGQEPFFTPEAFSFVDPSTGWLLIHVDAGMSHDYSHLYRTSDGGKTWERIVDPFGESLQGLRNTGIAFASEEYGWVTKDNLGVLPGTFLEQTEDGGRTWDNIFLPPPDDVNWESEPVQCKTYQPVFTSPQTGLVLVECSRPDGSGGLNTLSYVYSTSDRGQNWQHTRLDSPVSDLEFVSVEVGFAAGLDIYRTNNGGLNWVKIKTVTWQGQLSFVTENLGWAAAHKGENSALVLTDNGGLTWDLITPVTAP